jgi:hypothetical protein
LSDHTRFEELVLPHLDAAYSIKKHLPGCAARHESMLALRGPVSQFVT